MSTGTPNRLRHKREFSGVTTLLGMSRQDQIDFAWHDMRRFFKVTLWDRSHRCRYEKCPHPDSEIKTFEQATLDHIVPRSRGGRTRLANLQLMHAKCNSDKKSTMPKYYSPKAFSPPDSHRGTVTKYMIKKGITS